jgi:Outer membrane lipoprotein carrier protein LolA-like
MKRALAVCCFMLISLAAWAAAPVARIQSMIARPKVLCGRFDQQKQLVGLKKPIVANGRFCVIADKGVLWRTLQPFPNTVRLTRDEIVQFREDRVAMRLDAKQEPAVRMINGVLFAVLAGDLSQLEALFEIDGSIHGNSWNVAVKAQEPSVAKVISSIALQGDAYVKSVVLMEANGDRTAITFSSIETGDAAMSADEAALF